MALLGAVLVVVPAGAAHAGDGVIGVDCSRHPQTRECRLKAGIPGYSGSGSGNNGSGHSGAGSGRDDHCHYELVDPQAPPPAGADDGAWYVKVCVLDFGGRSMSQPMWIDGAADVDPAVLAQMARARLRMPRLVIRMSPAPPSQVVNVPTWLWLDAVSWAAPPPATAAVPGLTVVATARPSELTFTTGDGGRFTCPGPGTTWTRTADPASASPTCGHTYTRPGPFTLTATVTWTVSWAGGGQTGVVPNLFTTATSAVTVAEVQALN